MSDFGCWSSSTWRWSWVSGLLRRRRRSARSRGGTASLLGQRVEAGVDDGRGTCPRGAARCGRVDAAGEVAWTDSSARSTIHSTTLERRRDRGPKKPLVSGWCPRQDSNLRSRLRRAVLYPLSYGGRASTTLAHRRLRVAGAPRRSDDREVRVSAVDPPAVGAPRTGSSAAEARGRGSLVDPGPMIAGSGRVRGLVLARRRVMSTRLPCTRSTAPCAR